MVQTMLSGLCVKVIGVWVLSQLISQQCQASSTTPCMTNITIRKSSLVTESYMTKKVFYARCWLILRCAKYRYQAATRYVMKQVTETQPCGATATSHAEVTASTDTAEGEGPDFSTENNTNSALQGDDIQSPSAGEMAGAIIGLIALVAVIVAAIVAIVIFTRRRQKQRKGQSEIPTGPQSELTQTSSTTDPAAMYYVGPEDIMVRKSLARDQEANQTADKSTNEISDGYEETDFSQSNYSYNHLGEVAREGQPISGQDSITNPYDHFQSHTKINTLKENGATENETTAYYNYNGPDKTSGGARAAEEMTYDRLEHQTASESEDSRDIPSSDYDHVVNDTKAVRRRSSTEHMYSN